MSLEKKKRKERRNFSIGCIYGAFNNFKNRIASSADTVCMCVCVRVHAGVLFVSSDPLIVHPTCFVFAGVILGYR